MLLGLLAPRGVVGLRVPAGWRRMVTQMICRHGKQACNAGSPAWKCGVAVAPVTEREETMARAGRTEGR